MDFMQFFVNTGFVLLGLNFILFFYMICKGSTKPLQIFGWYLTAMMLVQCASFIIPYYGMQNLFLSHAYFIGQFVVLSFFYHKILVLPLQKKIVRISFIIVITFLAVYYVIYPEAIFRFNLFEIFITSYPLIIYALFHFYNLLSNKKKYYFINMGVLFYLFTSTVLFLLGNLTIFIESIIFSWNLNAILYVVYLLFILWEIRSFILEKQKHLPYGA